MIREAHEQRLARVLGCSLILAALLQGVVFWLRRVGWLDAELYHESYLALAKVVRLHPTVEGTKALQLLGASVHQLEGWLWLTKLAREAVWLAVLALAAMQFRFLRMPWSFAAGYAGLFALTALGAAQSLFRGAWLDLAAGGRASLTWLLGALAPTLATAALCRVLTRACLAVLIVQAMLAPVELMNGLPLYWLTLFGTDYGRVVGTFNIPISLGAFTVITWTMAVCWGELDTRLLRWLTALVITVLIANASATAWVAFLVAAASIGYFRLRLRWRVAMLAATLPLAMAVWLALPLMTGRAGTHDSLWGRIYLPQAYAARYLSVEEILIGHRFGAGTNAATLRDPVRGTSPPPSTIALGDSLPAALLWQIGMMGMLAGYWLMFLALRADPRSRPIGVAIFLLSLAVNITELFPVNLIVGLWLARAARVAMEGRPHG